MAREQEHAAGTGGQSGCGHLLHCFFTEVQENSRDTRRRSSLHFRILLDLPHHELHAGSGILAGVVSFHWGHKHRHGWDPCAAGTACSAQHREFPQAEPAAPGPAATWEHPEPQPGI